MSSATSNGETPHSAQSSQWSFVGRKRELTELDRGLEEAFAGRGRLFLLVGDPGIGKTRLAEELSAKARSRGAHIVWGRCWEGGGAPANWPWIQIIRSFARTVEEGMLSSQMGAGASYIAHLVPQIRGQLRSLPDISTTESSLEPERDRLYLFDAITTFLKNVSLAAPLMLVFDDLHAADVPSLLLLQFFARELHDSRILVLGTYRDVEARGMPAVPGHLSSILRDGHPIHLGGLSEAEVERLITNTAGLAPRPAVVGAVHRVTEGNPFFIDGVVRLLMAQGELENQGEVTAQSLKIPDEVRDSVRSRLRPLSEETTHLLTIASVTGREFDRSALELASGLPLERVLTLLAEASEAAIIEELSGALGRYRFSHALIRETVYEDLPPARRVGLHRQIGRILESLYEKNVESHLTELAHHFFEAIPGGEVDKAIDYAIRAGGRAMRMFAYEEAFKHYDRARTALELSASDDPRRLDLLLGLGDAAWLAQDPAESGQAFTDAAEIARKIRNPLGLARAALGFCREHVQLGSHEEENVRFLEEALNALGEGDSPLRARLLARLGGELLFTSQLERRQLLNKQAVEVARRVGDAATLAYALYRWHIGLVGTPGGMDQRLAASEEVLKLALRTGDRDVLARGQMLRIADLLELGDITAVDAELEAYARLGREIRHPLHVWLATTMHGAIALLKGRFGRAEQLAEQGLGEWQPSQSAMVTVNHATQIFQVRWEQGRLDEVESAVNGYVERFPRLAAFRCLLALLCCELGRVTDARSELERLAVNDFVDLPQDYLGPYCIWALSLVCAFLGDPRRAGQLYELLLPYAGRNILLTVGGGCLGSADQYLGLLAATMSHWDDAARHFTFAVEANSRMGARPALVRSRYHFAAMMLARGAPSDPEKASALLDQALDTARELGMTGLEEKATALKLAAVSPVSALSQKPWPEPTSRDNIFRREADFWTIAYEGEVFRLKDSKGLHFIAHLLGNPNKECHVSEIMAAVHGAMEAPTALPSARRAELDVSHSGLGDAGPMLDAKAKVEYRHRLSNLRSELEEARSFNDLGRIARAEQEIEFITDELARSLGLGGRDRRAASGTERARQNLTKAIKATLKKIAKANAPLGRHLSSTIKTGIFCSYSPDPRHPASWRF